MKFNRGSGILLHPTSFPGPDGIGDLGPEAYRWLSFLKESGCSYWQVLPLGPTGYGDSPYQCFSAFAGNPYLVSPSLLLAQHLLLPRHLADRPEFPPGQVDFGRAIQWKLGLLDQAYNHFLKKTPAKLTRDFQLFITAQEYWLGDYALFMAIKDTQSGRSWKDWPGPLRHREPLALEVFKESNQEAIRRHKFRQFLFFMQWNELRMYAANMGISIIGDIPIFLAYDSADVWANPSLFMLNKAGLPAFVAGVPPDYFSPTGQLWGNPTYRWHQHQDNGYSWWISRFKAILQMVDVVRLDHFRGFAGFWQIPAGNPTAEVGRWVKGPGRSLFESLLAAMGELPVIAEDLGEITPDVIALRDAYHFPGMRVFQFAFSSDPSDPFLPHNYPQQCVAYTGTHDNNTTRGWYETASEKERDFCRRYMASSGEDIAWDMIRVLWRSSAALTVAPLQDFLDLGSEARMNYPSTASGNWGWRYSAADIHPYLTGRIREMNHLYGRIQG